MGVSSDSVFRALGYSYRNVMPGDTSFMTTIGPVTSSEVAHPAGTLVNDNGTEYLNRCSGKLGIPTNEVFSPGVSLMLKMFLQTLLIEHCKSLV